MSSSRSGTLALRRLIALVGSPPDQKKASMSLRASAFRESLSDRLCRFTVPSRPAALISCLAITSTPDSGEPIATLRARSIGTEVIGESARTTTCR
jgi:hypothetical protein